MKKYLILLLLLIPSLSWGACTYTSGSIVCPVDKTTYDTSCSVTTCGEATSATIIESTDATRYYARWQINVPKNATITSAYIDVIASLSPSTGSGYVGLLDADDQGELARTYETWNLAISGDEIAYTPGAWTSGTAYHIPADADGIKALITSWIGRAGYDYGKYIGLRLRTNSGGNTRWIYQAYSSNPISTWPNLKVSFTGGDPVMRVYHNYPHSYTKQKIKLNLYNTINTQKIKVTLDTVPVSGFPRTVVAGLTTPGDEWIEIDYTSLTAGAHTLHIAITDSDDVEYASTVKNITWTTTHSGAPTVGIDENNSIILNGTTHFFPILTFMTSPNVLGTTPSYPLINAVNTTGCIGSYPDKNATTFQDYMTKSNQAGLRHVGPHTGSYWTSNFRKYIVLSQSYSETFEGTGYITGVCEDASDTDCFTETGAVDEDHTTTHLVGDQSVELDGTSAQATLAYTLKEDAARVRTYVVLKETTAHAAQDIITLKDSYGVALGKVTWNANGTITIAQGTTTKTTSGTYAANTVYYLWLDWTTASSYLVYGGFNFYINTSNTKPTVTLSIPEYTWDVGNQSGTGFGRAHTIELSANGSKIVYDGFTDWMDAIDDYVDAGKTGYDALLAWSWVDEPDIGAPDTANDIIRYKSWADRVKAKDTSHPTWLTLAGYQFGNQLYASGSAISDMYGPGKNASVFSGVPTPISDIIGYDYYPHEYSNYINTNIEDFLSAVDNLNLILGGVQPFFMAVENADVHDNYATSYLEVTDITGTFVKGDTITATSGGTCVIPTTTGPTINTYVRTGTTPQLILCSTKTGTFGVGDTLTATSGGTATYAATAAKQPCGWAKSYEWTPGPSDAQRKNEFWLSIIHGIKGIQYFDSFCSEGNWLSSESKTSLESFKTSIDALVEHISSPLATTFTTETDLPYKKVTVAGSGRVDAMAKTYGGVTYIFAARVPLNSEGWPSTSGGTETATFNVSGLELGANIARYGEGTTFTAQGAGYFTDTFTDYAVHIYQLDSTVTSHTVTVTKAGDGSGTVTSSPSGVNCGASCAVEFTDGITVVLTAAPTGDNTFTGWSTTSGQTCGCTGTSTCTLTSITADKGCTATFAQPEPPEQFAVTISYAGTGFGVTDPIAGITAYTDGATATTTQTPTSPSTFTGWSGTCGCTGTGACAPTITADCTIIATWADATRYMLNIYQPLTNARITSADGFIDCGNGASDCSYDYATGTEVTLTGECFGVYYNPTFYGDCTGATCAPTMSAVKSIGLTCTNGSCATIGSGGTMTLGAGGSGGGPTCNTETDKLGTTNTGGVPPSIAKDTVYCILHTPSCYGSLQKAYAAHEGATASSGKICVYSDDGDSLANVGDLKIGCSGDISSSSTEWAYSDMDGGTLASGSYWVCFAVKADATSAFALDRSSVTYPLAYKTSSGFYASPPNNLNGLSTVSGAGFSIYVTVGP